MKELFLISAESTKESLVLRTEDDEQYFLVVTDDLRTALVGESTPSTDGSRCHQLRNQLSCSPPPRGLGPRRHGQGGR